MIESTADQQQIEAARRVGAKLQALLDGLTLDEQQVLDGALRHIGTAANVGVNDARGYLSPQPFGIVTVQKMTIVEVINELLDILSGKWPAP